VVLDWYEGQEKVDLSDYVNSGTWNIMSCPGNYTYTFDPVEKHHKAQITFTLQIRRKTLFYTVNLIIPCVLISFLSVSVFYLPADAGEKMTMCISILLALIVFLLLVSKILPPTSITIPLIAKYLLFTFIMNIITILITVIIINWNFKTPRTHRMPGWVRAVFLNYLPRALLMTRPHHAERWAKKAYSRRDRPSLDPNYPTASMACGYDRRGVRLRSVSGGYQYEAAVSRLSMPASIRASPPLPSAVLRLGTSVPPSTELDDRMATLQQQFQRRSQNCQPMTVPPPSTTVTGYDADVSARRRTPIAGRGESVDVCCESQLRQQQQQQHTIAAAVFDARFMAPETQKAIDAVRFIAAHLKNEDDYAEVGME
jgi:hypothetical protein